MKKTYIIPSTSVEQAEAVKMLAASIVGKVDNSEEIGYGGIDEDGSQDPCVKEGIFELDF